MMHKLQLLSILINVASVVNSLFVDGPLSVANGGIVAGRSYGIVPVNTRMQFQFDIKLIGGFGDENIFLYGDGQSDGRNPIKLNSVTNYNNQSRFDLHLDFQGETAVIQSCLRQLIDEFTTINIDIHDNVVTMSKDNQLCGTYTFTKKIVDSNTIYTTFDLFISGPINYASFSGGIITNFKVTTGMEPMFNGFVAYDGKWYSENIWYDPSGSEATTINMGDGNIYDEFIVLNPPNNGQAYAEYNLNGNYERFTGLIGPPSGIISCGNWKTIISVDGIDVRNIQHFSDNKKYMELDISVSGGNILRITTDSLGSYSCDQAVIANPVLWMNAYWRLIMIVLWIFLIILICIAIWLFYKIRHKKSASL